MSKPEDIPQAVWDEATELADEITFELSTDQFREFSEVIARSILSAEKRGEEREREACAEVGADACEQFVRYKVGSAWSDEAGNAVEVAIRKRVE